MQRNTLNIITAICVLLCMAPGSSSAKEKNDTTYQYFDYQWKKAKQKNAHYYAKIWAEGNGWRRQDYFMVGNRLQMDGHYLDTDHKVQDGNFTYYFANGAKQQQVIYRANKKIGEEIIWFENGQMQQKFHYKDGMMVDSNTAWNANGQLSMLAILDGTGTGTGETFSDEGTKAGSGLYLHGKRDGVWTFKDDRDILSQIVTYAQDSAVAIKNYDEKGLETRRGGQFVEKPAEFDGGLDAYRLYLERNLRYPESSQKAGIQGVASLVMQVDKTGKVVLVELLDAPDAATGAEALRVLRNCPNWTPAIQNNRKVNYRFTQKVTFVFR